MHSSDIEKAVESVEQYLQAQSEPGPRADVPAIATIEDGLKCRIESPDGTAIYTDMPKSIGGSASANSPGWHLRAALASCDATLLAIRAARLGLNLNSIEVGSKPPPMGAACSSMKAYCRDPPRCASTLKSRLPM